MNTNENQNTTLNASNYQPTKKKNDYKGIIIGFLTAALLSSVAFNWYSKKEEKGKDIQQEKVITETAVQKTEIDQTYQAALVRLDSITNLNTSLNKEITSKSGNIAKLRSDIESLIQQKLAAGKLSDLQEATLKSKISQLNKEIDNFKDRVVLLEKQNQDLVAENTIVKKDLDSTKAILTNTKGNLDQTVTQKKELETKIEVGATLNAANFSLVGINEKSNGKEKETTIAKRVDKIRIGFDLIANRITETGKKKIYVCITAPDGTPITVEALGSGKFVTKDEGEKFFTNSLDVDYTQGQTKYINFDWKQNSAFVVGSYKIEVYQNGYKIGQSNITFKKGGLFS